jgi:hypothetical protein
MHIINSLTTGSKFSRPCESLLRPGSTFFTLHQTAGQQAGRTQFFWCLLHGTMAPAARSKSHQHIFYSLIGVSQALDAAEGLLAKQKHPCACLHEHERCMQLPTCTITTDFWDGSSIVINRWALQEKSLDMHAGQLPCDPLLVPWLLSAMVCSSTSSRKKAASVSF